MRLLCHTARHLEQRPARCIHHRQLVLVDDGHLLAFLRADRVQPAGTRPIDRQESERATKLPASVTQDSAGTTLETIVRRLMIQIGKRA